MARQTRIGKWSYGFDDQQNVWADHRGYDGAVIGGSIPVTGFMINDKGWYNQDDIKQRPYKLSLEIFYIRRGSESYTYTCQPLIEHSCLALL